MQTMWQRALAVADQTPESRNRLIDFLRVFSIVIVVFGHWLAAVPFVEDGVLQLTHVLELSRPMHFITWALQIMPIFFMVGGYSNGKSLTAARRDGTRRREWLASRYHRLMTPILPFLVVWSILVVVLGYFVERGLLRLASQVAAVPLWFLAVYLLAVALAPWTFAAWRRWRWATVLAPIGLAVVFDMLRLNEVWTGYLGVSHPAWTNYLWVWLTVHQLGYYWAERDTELPPRWGLPIVVGGLAGLVGLTVFGPYPVALIGVDSEAFSNTTPPTIVLFAQTCVQIGLITLLAPRVKRWLAHRKVWAAIVLVSGMIMSLYVWHLTAMVLAIGVGSALGNLGFSIDPLTPTWWWTRPVWFAVNIAFLVPLVLAFAGFERRAQTGERAPRPLALGIGIVVSALGLGGAAAFGTAQIAEFPLRWWVPLAVIVGTFLAGMSTLVPRR